MSAQILTTPEPSLPITLATHLSPLAGLSTRAFHNIICIANPEKHIEIWPHYWPQYRWDSEDLRSDLQFVTIPALGQGSYVVRHILPQKLIHAADLQKGERYKVSLTDKCLGTIWWTPKGPDELEGWRLKAWKGETEIQAEQDDSEWWQQREQELREMYGDKPTHMGEEPEMLAMVESENVEFEIV